MPYIGGKPTAIDVPPKSLEALAGQVKDLANFIDDELKQVGVSQGDLLNLKVLYVAPTKPRQGMVVYADGTHWNPGAGEGPYVYESDNTWHALLYTAPAVSNENVGEISWRPFTRAPSAKFKVADGSTFVRASFPDLTNFLIHSSTVTFTNGSANITWTGHGFTYLNEPVKFYTTGTLPTNFTAGTAGTGGTFYYVKSIVNANTITVSATPGGVAISAGSAGSGTHTAVNAPWGDGDGSTTAHLPNLLGEFTRAWDAQRGIDSNRGFGADQLDAFQGHRHGATASSTATPNAGALVFAGAGANGAAAGATGVPALSISVSTSVTVTDPTADLSGDGTPRTAAETRPRNQTLMPFIRVLA